MPPSFRLRVRIITSAANGSRLPGDSQEPGWKFFVFKR
jgi:hypothetical protein